MRNWTAVVVVIGLLLTGTVLAEAATSRIGNASGAVGGSVALSVDTFTAGEAGHVVLGRADTFADSMAGAALALEGGPLLFTPVGAQLDTRVEGEIRRVLGAPNGCAGGPEVFLLGGTSAVSAAAEARVTQMGYCTTRLAGPSRVETAVEVARFQRSFFAADRVLVARADDWADAAPAGAVAADTGSAFLVTDGARLHPAVAAYLADFPPAEIVVLGGSAAISQVVATDLARFAPVRRVAGAARDRTSVAVAVQLWSAVQSVSLVNGYREDGWVFAFAGAVSAARRDAPVLFVDANRIDQDVLALTSQARDVILVGPPQAVPDTIVSGASGTPAVLAGEPVLQSGTPKGVATDAANRLHVNFDQVSSWRFASYDLTNGEQVTGFDAGSFFDSGLGGPLAIDPDATTVWHVAFNRFLQLVDFQSGQLVTVLDLRAVDVDTTAMFDFAIGTVHNGGGVIVESASLYGDLAVLPAPDGGRTFFIAASSQGFPWVLRLTVIDNAIAEARALVFSSANAAPFTEGPRGLAVNPEGTVLTTLPRRAGEGNLDTFAFFPAGYEPTSGATVGTAPVDAVAAFANGMTADAAGNFYVVTTAVGIFAPGAIPGGGQTDGGTLAILPPTLDRFLGLGDAPAPSTTAMQDVAVSPDGGAAFVTVPAHNEVWRYALQ